MRRRWIIGFPLVAEAVPEFKAGGVEYPKTRQKVFKNLDERTLIRRAKRHRGSKNVVGEPTRRIVPRAGGSEECFGRAA
jgi:hypothetical protein